LCIFASCVSANRENRRSVLFGTRRVVWEGQFNCFLTQVSNCSDEYMVSACVQGFWVLHSDVCVEKGSAKSRESSPASSAVVSIEVLHQRGNDLVL
jgi:hypothetical protein